MGAGVWEWFKEGARGLARTDLEMGQIMGRRCFPGIGSVRLLAMLLGYSQLLKGFNKG